MDRKEELDKLLEKLKKADTDNNTDVDLILSYLEEFLSTPDGKGGSRKLLEFNIDIDSALMAKTYQMKWKQTMEEVVNPQIFYDKKAAFK